MKHRHTVLFALLAAALSPAAFAQADAQAGKAPIAAGNAKFLGSAYAKAQAKDFTIYWNKVTPENAGKWGEVEKRRDRMDWRGLDEAYRIAKDNHLPFQMHVMVWGNQQPEWIEKLPVAEQREEIEEWFAAVAQRYPELDYVEVVNEPLNDPPNKDDKGGGNYIEALGGSGATGWDWIVESYRLARKHFPNSKLLINDYNITNKSDATKRYREIIDILRRENLVDGIGVQGARIRHDAGRRDVGAQGQPRPARRNRPADLRHRTGHRRPHRRAAAEGLPAHLPGVLGTSGGEGRDAVGLPPRPVAPEGEGVSRAQGRQRTPRPEVAARVRERRGGVQSMTHTHAVAALCALLSFALPAAATEDCAQPAAVCDDAVNGALALVDHGRVARVLFDDGDFPGVLRAVRDLEGDLAKVAGGAQPGKVAIIAGTLGASPRIDRIVAQKNLDTRGVAGTWEGYLLQVVERPEPGIDRALIVAGADRRGTIFGLYELSRRLGVSPWNWWADVPVQTRKTRYIAPGRHVDAPQVRYRGIFLNDEDPALGGWIKATYGGPNHRFYERVFELVLRLKGNYLWPAMWGRAFADDDPRNPELADEYGIVIGTSHHEPMMRAHVEWERHGKGPWDYTKNANTLRAFWRDGIVRMGDRESVVTLGMRGDGDEPMTQGTAIDLLQAIVGDQRNILGEVTGKPLAQTPQVWALYKEVQDYFDAGMQVPDDVTLLFSDDNWGNIRRLPQPGQTRGGGYGVYYHFDYVGGPRNYKWINTVQIERTWEQMQRARAHGADRLWVVNVGDLKPMEFPISLFLDLAWNPEAITPQRLHDYPADWAAQQFGPQHAREIGELLTRYTQYNARRKPELLSPDTFSLVNFHEAQRVLADWQSLSERAQRIGEQLPQAYRDAYFQLVEYPVLASANLTAMYVAVGRNHLYAVQGRHAAANAQAVLAKQLFDRDAELARIYERDIAGGKWIHMMSQPRIGYTGWQQPEGNVMPQLMKPRVPTKASLGVTMEGATQAWPGASERARLPELDPVAASSRELVVFNRGTAPLRYTATTSQPWLHVQPQAGDVGDERALRVDIDWNALPAGTHDATITLRGSDGTQVAVAVPAWKPAADAGIRGFVESDGHIAIDAAHHARAVAPAGQEWRTIPNLGRTLSGVTVAPATAPARLPDADAPRLEYPIHLRDAGEVEVRVVMSPALDVQHRGGMRYAIAIGDEPPQVVTVKADPTPDHADFAAWTRAVSDSVQVASSRHRVRAGNQTLTLWSIDPGLVFQRVELVRGTPRASYLGPPESPKL